jgi:hypothetical protein
MRTEHRETIEIAAYALAIVALWSAIFLLCRLLA